MFHSAISYPYPTIAFDIAKPPPFSAQHLIPEYMGLSLILAQDGTFPPTTYMELKILGGMFVLPIGWRVGPPLMVQDVVHAIMKFFHTRLEWNEVRGLSEPMQKFVDDFMSRNGGTLPLKWQLLGPCTVFGGIESTNFVHELRTTTREEHLKGYGLLFSSRLQCADKSFLA